ncbi:MAG: formate/nitrite transporter family protein [Gemmatimonadota bacterium]|nr:formate/nitrite transporter family protein [Gemmatimonadota bacterium]
MADQVTAPESEEPKSYAEILQQEIEGGLRELHRPAGGLLTSGLSAGLDLGFSVLLMAVMLTLVEGQLPPPIERILIANMYAVGFIFVIIGRSELFTEHTTLAVLPVLDGRASMGRLGRLGGLVYTSNVVGATVFAALAATIGPALGVARSGAFVEIGRGLVEHEAWVIVASAVLAGWLMGLMSWLVAAGRDTISQIFVVWLIATSIGLAHLHHSIAGTVEVLAAVFSGPEVGWIDFGRFLVWTTIGNAGGGVIFVALIKYGHVKQGGQDDQDG